MLRLTTLGTLDLRDRLGRPVRDVLAQPKRIALFVHLAMAGRRGPVQRDRVLAMFWPESDEAKARNALSQSLYHLRQALGQDVLLSQGATLEVARDQLWCDAIVLEEALAAGETELALDIYKGEFCPALHAAGSSALEDWVSDTRRELRRALLESARRGVDKLDESGDATGAARIARRALVLVPEDERDVRRYLECVDRAGDRAGALALYAEYARRLAAEIEAEPAPETVALVERMRRRRTPAATIAVETHVDTSITASGAAAVPSPAPALLPDQRSRTAAHATAPEVPHRTRRYVLAGVAALLVLVWGISARARLGSAASGTGSPSQAIAVFPFTVRGADSTSMPGDAMADLLAATLGGVDELRPIDPRTSVLAAEGRTPDPAHGAQLGHSLGAEYFVLGDLIERAGRLQINGALYETATPSQALATATVTGDTANLFKLVDDLAGRLLARVLEGRDTELTRLAAVTTSSLPALKAYLRGERAMRDGLDARAAAAFREAVEIDSSFALANYRLAVVANWITVPGIPDPLIYAERAARHSERLTPLGRDLLDAFRAYKAPDPGVEARYRALVQAYPDNIEAWYMLAETQFHYGPFVGHPATDARGSFERVLQLQPMNLHARLHLARIATREGRAREVDTLVTQSIDRFSEAERIAELRMLRALVRHDTTAIRLQLASLESADEIVIYSVVQSAISYADALDVGALGARTLRRTATAPVTRDYADLIEALIPLGRGQWRTPMPSATTDPVGSRWRLQHEVLAALEPSMGISRARLVELRTLVTARTPWTPVVTVARPLPREFGDAMRLHLLALLDLRLGDLGALAFHTDSLETIAKGAKQELVEPLLISLRAEVLRARGRDADALAEYQKYPLVLRPVVFGTSSARERFAIAELLAKLGRDEEARRMLATFPASFELAYVALARLRLAELLEQAGQRAEAAAYYGRALAIWRDADPEFAPLVKRARDGLARVH